MYDKLIDNLNQNYFINLPAELLYKIVEDLPYNPTLAQLSMTCTNLHQQVLHLPCGENVKKIRALKRSYVETLFTNDYAFMALTYSGMITGGIVGVNMYNNDIVSIYLSLVGGMVLGGISSSVITGYLMGGLQGMQTGIDLSTDFFSSVFKLFLKGQGMIVDTALSNFSRKKVVIAQNLIQDSPSKIIDKLMVKSISNLSFFKQKNINIQNEIIEQQQQLSRPIKGK